MKALATLSDDVATHMQSITGAVEQVKRAYDIAADELRAGRGALKKKLQSEIASSPLRDHVVMAGYRRHDLPETYAMLDVGLFLGMGSEGTCRAALETLAMRIGEHDDARPGTIAFGSSDGHRPQRAGLDQPIRLPYMTEVYFGFAA